MATAGAGARSPFRVLNPKTLKYQYGPEQSGASRRRPPPFKYFAISYVWSDWKAPADASLPSWDLLHNRLLQLTTTEISSGDATPHGQPEAFWCWIDCKCIDQSSPADKAYWIPRMNEIFYGAQCTILLLRDFDLTAPYQLFQVMQCMFAGGPAAGAASQHRCLFAPSCSSLAFPITPELEDCCLETLQALWNGDWRKRAWIFQEILLSERYILLWGDATGVFHLDLETIGHIAAFLHTRHPQKVWLHQFWSWCKRCVYIRQFYSESCDMEATLLQLAQDLESTIPCDKYYALCGILGLDNVQYNPLHTAEQALDSVVAALTREGRMGWMYAIPPSITDGLTFNPTSMAPFILTKKRRQASTELREPFFSTQFLGVMALELGSVTGDDSFDEVLRRMQLLDDSVSQLGRAAGRRFNYLKELYSNATALQRRFPDILFRLGYDTFAPLCDANQIRLLFNALDASELNGGLLETDLDCCVWFVVLRLCFISQGEIDFIGNVAGRQVVRMSAAHVRDLCHSLCHDQRWRILKWQRSSDPSRAAAGSEPRFAAFSGTLPTIGKTVWSVQTRQSSSSLLFLAGEDDAPYALDFHAEMSMKKLGSGPSSRDPGLPVPRSGFSDTSLRFHGVLHQIRKAPYSADTFKSAFHDNPDKREVPDDLLDKLKHGMKTRFAGSSSGSRLTPSQMRTAKFLTFQRKDGFGTPGAIRSLPPSGSGSNSYLPSDTGSSSLASSYRPDYLEWSPHPPGPAQSQASPADYYLSGRAPQEPTMSGALHARPRHEIDEPPHLNPQRSWQDRSLSYENSDRSSLVYEPRPPAPPALGLRGHDPRQSQYEAGRRVPEHLGASHVPEPDSRPSSPTSTSRSPADNSHEPEHPAGDIADQDMPKLSRLREMFPHLDDETLEGVILKHGIEYASTPLNRSQRRSANAANQCRRRC